MADLQVYTDGGSRGNPGPAATGWVIQDALGLVLAEGNEYIGITTNNQAEYSALIQALEALPTQIQATNASTVVCNLDSQLVVKQLNGEYKVKHPDMKPLYSQVLALVKILPCHVVFTHIPRAENAHADALVNQALDARLS